MGRGGAVTAAKLRDRGIRTVGQVARLDEQALVSMLAPAAGRRLHALAHNRDARPLRVGRRRGSIGSQRALGRPVRSVEEVDATLVALVDRVSRRLRSGRRLCRTVVLRLRFSDFTRASRSRTLPGPTSRTRPLLDAARELLAAATPAIESRGLTLVGVALENLRGADGLQLALPLEPDDGALDDALDAVRDRHGSAAVTRAVLLGRDPGIAMPLLPD